MDLLNDFLEKKDIRYFYHVTNTDCNEILENDLYNSFSTIYNTFSNI